MLKSESHVEGASSIASPVAGWLFIFSFGMIEILRSLMYTVISSANRDPLISFPSICIPLIPLNFLIVLATISSNLLNRYGGRGQPHLLLDLSGNTMSFVAQTLMLGINYPYYVEEFYHEGVFHDVKDFFLHLMR